jgi:hypothetical protein
MGLHPHAPEKVAYTLREKFVFERIEYSGLLHPDKGAK